MEVQSDTTPVEPVLRKSRYKNDWSLEQKKQIAEFYNRDLSYREIAAKLGVEKNAIAGIIFRIRKNHPELIKKTKNEARAQKKQSKPDSEVSAGELRRRGRIIQARTLERLTYAAATKPKRVRLRVITDEKQVKLNELIVGMCHWPIGDPRLPDFRYCGRTVRDNNCPYCLEHAVLAYIPPKRRYS